MSGVFHFWSIKLDRIIVDPSAVVLDTDILSTNKNMMLAMGRLAQDMLGVGTSIGGAACAPGTGLTVVVGPGGIYSSQNVDNTSYGSLAADTAHQTVKQGSLFNPFTLACPAPVGVGQSINYLIEGQYQEADNNPAVVPYYNSANPLQPFHGPGNNGLPQNTLRQGLFVVQAKAGVAATTGSQVAPTVDAGWVVMYVVTVDHGESSLVSGDIVVATGAPFIGVTALNALSKALADTLYSPLIVPTAAEIATSVTVANQGIALGDLRRFGVVPNSTGAAATNSAIMATLFNPSISNGPTGEFYFPNITGVDVYSFSGVIPIRPGVRLDLGGSTISYIGTGVTADSNSGLFFALQDFECRNGNLSSTYATGVATSCGNVIQIGARGTDSARWPFAVWDSTTPQGNIRLRNLRITMNVTGAGLSSASAIALTGGLKGVILEDIYINGSGTLPQGIANEFGWATSDAQPSARQTSHMSEFSFDNINISNMDNSVSTSAGIVLAGAYNGTIENYKFTGVSNGIISSAGESMFYRPWAGVDDICGKHSVTIGNVTGSNFNSNGLVLSGTTARVANSGYLQRAWVSASNYGVRETVTPSAPAWVASTVYVVNQKSVNNGIKYICTVGGTSASSGGPTGTGNGIVDNGVTWNFDPYNMYVCTTGGTAAAQTATYFGPTGTGSGITDGTVTWNYVPLSANTDQLDYVLEGQINLAGNISADGIACSAGYLKISGSCNLQGMANGIFMLTECTRFDIEGVRGGGAQLAGFDLGTPAGQIWPTLRLKRGSVKNCYIAGNSLASFGANPGIFVNNCISMLIENCRLNYDVNYGGVAEVSQGPGVTASTNAHGVVCRNNHVGNVIGGGNTAYLSIATSGTLNGNDIQSPTGNLSQLGPWNNDGSGNAITANLNSKTSNINTFGKYFGRRCFNADNNRLLFATGPNNTDNWAYCDGNAPGTITPS